MSLQVEGANDIPTCHGGLENLDEEYSYEVTDISGKLPSDLHGTFFRNGPGRQRIGKEKYGHWFDGDGMLCAFTFDNGKLHFKNRYVRTQKYIRETEQQQILYRGFGTQLPGGFFKNFLKMPANPANTSVMYHGDHLLALNEGGKPWELDPVTLETIGEFTYDGALRPSQVFSAHGKIHPTSGDYINFGAGISGVGLKGPKPCLNMYRINPTGKLFLNRSIPLDTFPFCHDFALTEKYAVFFLGSIVFGNMGNVILGTRSISDQVTFDPDIAMQIVVVDLNSLEEVKRFHTEAGAIIHFGNAFEEDGNIIIDGMYASDFEANKTLQDVFNPEGRFNGGTYMRYKLNMQSGDLSANKVTEVESEFPTFNNQWATRRNQINYSAVSIDNGAHSFFNGIQRITFDGDANVVTLPPGYYGSEPLFAPRDECKNEDDGYILELVYNGFEHVSELMIFRADNLGEQVCQARLKHHVPHQFHGHFVSEIFDTRLSILAGQVH